MRFHVKFPVYTLSWCSVPLRISFARGNMDTPPRGQRLKAARALVTVVESPYSTIHYASYLAWFHLLGKSPVSPSPTPYKSQQSRMQVAGGSLPQRSEVGYAALWSLGSLPITVTTNRESGGAGTRRQAMDGARSAQYWPG